MIYRTLAQRVPKPVPFLSFDRDPYLAIVDGDLTWIWDAYTTTNDYPYSQSIDLQEATEDPLVPSELVNYMRNSVKVTVNAYDGTMKYFADFDDPIIRSGLASTPDLFTPMDRGRRGAPRALPLPREPLPGAGHPVRDLSRGEPGGLLPRRGSLGGRRRPDPAGGACRPAPRRPRRSSRPNGCAPTTC